MRSLVSLAQKYKNPLIVISCIAVFLGGWWLSYMHYEPIKSEVAVLPVRENNPNFHFINPLLLVDNSNIVYPEFKNLNDALESKISIDEDSGLATDISVYYRDMNGSKWAGVNENDLYSPSSMLKVATLIAYLKSAQDNPQLLHTVVTNFTDTKDPGQYYQPTDFFNDGDYTIRDLLIHMITDSDNPAMVALNKLNPSGVAQIYKDFQLPNPSNQSKDFMSAVDYSRILRALYNSTYLDRDYSEQALNLLSFTHFNKGITQSTGSLTVAHKFGEHTELDSNGNLLYRELHDCGIVYYPNKPYLLCVMTKGNNFPDLEHVIRDMSNIVYQYVKNS